VATHSQGEACGLPPPPKPATSCPLARLGLHGTMGGPPRHGEGLSLDITLSREIYHPGESLSALVYVSNTGEACRWQPPRSR